MGKFNEVVEVAKKFGVKGLEFAVKNVTLGLDFNNAYFCALNYAKDKTLSLYDYIEEGRYAYAVLNERGVTFSKIVVNGIPYELIDAFQKGLIDDAVVARVREALEERQVLRQALGI